LLLKALLLLFQDGVVVGYWSLGFSSNLLNRKVN
jgi:hypothetical protein